MGNMQITNAPTRSQADTLFMVVEHLAERPAPGTPGRVCFIRDTGVYFIDLVNSGQHNFRFPPIRLSRISKRTLHLTTILCFALKLIVLWDFANWYSLPLIT